MQSIRYKRTTSVYLAVDLLQYSFGALSKSVHK